MKYLNLGCGAYYSTNKEWVNIDFVSSEPNVIAHNLLKGIPFDNDTFDFVYHSHVLEHFTKKDGADFIKECSRVLKKNGIIRIAVPDLERIAREYLITLEAGIKEPDNEIARANYEWMVLEMYDQTMRNSRGGEMGNYLHQEVIINEKFVFNRIGEEGRAFRNEYLSKKTTSEPDTKNSILSSLKQYLKSFITSIKGIDEKAYAAGKFRFAGEIHQWMYDRYSLTQLLKQNGFEDIVVKDAFNSYLNNWSEYEIDGKNNVIRKPDSLFMEARKK